MTLALNLRFDLARLTDAELAQRCDAIWADVDQMQDDRGTIRTSPRWRGPVRHPRAYLFWAMVRGSSAEELEILLSAFAANTSLADVVSRLPRIRLHLALCEMQDILDEMKSRTRSPLRPAPSRPESI
ncbi:MULTISPECIES: hypothetical protein [Xanthobacter]|uniref:Transposase n=1 Tax=Xanthobacter aminoxidans TaxID=186280 RepID=A0ABW6ZEQ9_9HYPH|nr:MULTISPECIES: hypothetical protein [Xanthobacter]MCL8384952.1 hypothetical protein [Xanthobacter aminoxidans]